MFFQDPSLLHFQKRLEQNQQRNNLRNIFNVQNIPSNNQLRDVLDEISSEALAPIFKDFYEKLRRQKFMICGDGLMSNQPMIEETIKGDMHYLFVTKPGNHKYLVEWLSTFEQLPSTEVIDDKGNRHIYT